MRIAWYSNTPTVNSGYGTQTKQMLNRLAADGHEVAVLGLWGQIVGIGGYQTPSGAVVPLFPMGSMHYGLDVVDKQARDWLEKKPGWVISLYDVWPLKDSLWQGLNVASWTPIDHKPVPSGVMKWADKHRTIAMSRFGQAELAAAGVEAPYIPHALDLSVWKPTPSDIRAQLVGDDGFLVMMNAANIKPVHFDRKAWQQNLRAFAIFAKTHPDAVLYLHTDPARPDGFPIASYLSYLGLDEKQTRVADLSAYRGHLIGEDVMVGLYSAADVLLSCSMGEGFGLAVPEAMACGTPAIVTDFSAQPEIVGDTGWKVYCEPFWDEMQRTDLAIPSIASIIESLEEAYAERGTQKAQERSAAAIARVAAEYDADVVYAEKWRPYLADLEAQLAPPVKANREQRPSQKKAKAA